MKTILKIWWKIALVMVLAGVALLILGFSFGARGGYVYFSAGRLHFATADAYYIVQEPDLPAFDAIEIMARSADIEIIKSDHYGLEMRLPEYEDGPEWGITDGKLTVDASLADNIITFMSFGFNQSHYIKVYVPGGGVSGGTGPDSDKLKSVDLTTRSGNIKMQGIPADRIEISASSGYIKVDTPYYRSATAHATSGDIIFNGAGDKASLKLSASSGVITADASGCDAVDIDVKSGNITLSGDTNATAEIRAKASSGKIDINVAAWESLAADTNSGNIEITGDPHGATSANARAGNVTMRLAGEESDYSYEISASAGTIRVGGRRVGSPARSINNAAGNTINIKTSSGSARVDFDR